LGALAAPLAVDGKLRTGASAPTWPALEKVLGLPNWALATEAQPNTPKASVILDKKYENFIESTPNQK
jgi:hypothetical protein